MHDRLIILDRVLVISMYTYKFNTSAENITFNKTSLTKVKDLAQTQSIAILYKRLKFNCHSNSLDSSQKNKFL